MILGVVGSEAAKFTEEMQERARRALRALYHEYDPDEVVSGRCHLGGIDIWAIEEARRLGIITQEFPPEVLQWNPPGRIGFMRRNIQIAEASDLVVCITLKTLPDTYTGMRFKVCYHHDPPATDHIKSGGCWTTRRAERLMKQTRLVILE